MLHRNFQQIQNRNMFRHHPELSPFPWTPSLPLRPCWHLALLETRQISAQVDPFCFLEYRIFSSRLFTSSEDLVVLSPPPPHHHHGCIIVQPCSWSDQIQVNQFSWFFGQEPASVSKSISDWDAFLTTIIKCFSLVIPHVLSSRNFLAVERNELIPVIWADTLVSKIHSLVQL